MEIEEFETSGLEMVGNLIGLSQTFVNHNAYRVGKIQATDFVRVERNLEQSIRLLLSDLRAQPIGFAAKYQKVVLLKFNFPKILSSMTTEIPKPSVGMAGV